MLWNEKDVIRQQPDLPPTAELFKSLVYARGKSRPNPATVRRVSTENRNTPKEIRRCAAKPIRWPPIAGTSKSAEKTIEGMVNSCMTISPPTRTTLSER
jgi:hypothetical protein